MGDELLDLWGPVFTIAYYAIGIPICWLARPFLSLTSGPPFLIRLFFLFSVLRPSHLRGKSSCVRKSSESSAEVAGMLRNLTRVLSLESHVT
jgi:hypothetical protein